MAYSGPAGLLSVPTVPHWPPGGALPQLDDRARGPPQPPLVYRQPGPTKRWKIQSDRAINHAHGKHHDHRSCSSHRSPADGDPRRVRQLDLTCSRTAVSASVTVLSSLSHPRSRRRAVVAAHFPSLKWRVARAGVLGRRPVAVWMPASLNHRLVAPVTPPPAKNERADNRRLPHALSQPDRR